jgi:hypothetical protein
LKTKASTFSCIEAGMVGMVARVRPLVDRALSMHFAWHTVPLGAFYHVHLLTVSYKKDNAIIKKWV